MRDRRRTVRSHWQENQSSRPVGDAWHVRQVFANGNQTDPARHVAHTKKLSQGVRENAQTVPERNLSTWNLQTLDRFIFVDRGNDYCYHLGRLRQNYNLYY